MQQRGPNLPKTMMPPRNTALVRWDTTGTPKCCQARRPADILTTSTRARRRCEVVQTLPYQVDHLGVGGGLRTKPLAITYRACWPRSTTLGDRVPVAHAARTGTVKLRSFHPVPLSTHPATDCSRDYVVGANGGSVCGSSITAIAADSDHFERGFTFSATTAHGKRRGVIRLTGFGLRCDRWYTPSGSCTWQNCSSRHTRSALIGHG